MKGIIIITLLLVSINCAHSQTEGVLYKNDLQRLYINEDISLHFVSPEPIQYVDISTKNMVGDIPVENVFRIKAIDDSVQNLNGINKSLGVVTIIGQKYIAQYDLWYSADYRKLETQVDILPTDTNPLDIGATPLSTNELRHFAIEAYKKKKSKFNIYSTQYGISGRVNNILTFEDYVFLDITFTNKTDLKFDLDQVRFKIEDKRITKATNVQAIEIEPEYQLFNKTSFKKSHRNIYAIKKFTFPNNKVLSIELTESQISGRTLVLQLDYSDLLTADTL
jgi:conjugative transposon TraN protein